MMTSVSVQSKRADEEKAPFPSGISEILGSSHSPRITDITDMTESPGRAAL
jgi:hypothetical protein